MLTSYQNHLCYVLFTLREFIYNYVYNPDTPTGPNRPDLAFFSVYNARRFYCLIPDIFTRQWGTPRSHWVHHSQKNCVHDPHQYRPIIEERNLQLRLVKIGSYVIYYSKKFCYKSLIERGFSFSMVTLLLIGLYQINLK